MDTSDIERPVCEYRSLNEFFARRLRPGARPIHRQRCAPLVTTLTLACERGPQASFLHPSIDACACREGKSLLSHSHSIDACACREGRHAVQPADCRLHVFESASEATRLWIKGRGFSVRQLLGSLADSMDLQGCSLAISRRTARPALVL